MVSCVFGPALMSGLLFLVHLLACICGSIIRGQRRELSKMMALSIDSASSTETLSNSIGSSKNQVKQG